MTLHHDTGRYVSYRSTAFPDGIVGVLSTDNDTLTPLRLPTGQPARDLLHLIVQWEHVTSGLIPSTPTEPVDDVEILAPVRGRDVLCVGYNYKKHRDEFQTTGYDQSVVNDYPKVPIIFTKRATSIVASGTPIYLHPRVTSAVDYEGELGIIIGKGGRGIKREDAWSHVWGATIINDVSARDRQKEHKQFYIGKSLDTFCPMGPYAVHASALDFDKMHLTTTLNGKTVQSQSTSELIFSIPELIETLSMGITLQPGDVIATGTPEGVAAAHGNFLKDGDEVAVSITGLGELRNPVKGD